MACCCFTRKSFKRDEVSPISIQPKNMSDERTTTANGKPKPEVSARETTPPTQEETEPTNQNGSAEVAVSTPVCIMHALSFLVFKFVWTSNGLNIIMWPVLTKRVLSRFDHFWDIGPARKHSKRTLVWHLNRVRISKDRKVTTSCNVGGKWRTIVTVLHFCACSFYQPQRLEAPFVARFNFF